MTDYPEDEYLADLKQQRHMYAWCLINIGGFTEDDASLESEKFYPYQTPEQEYRWLVFHDDAWHWAMLKIKGEQYWIYSPELANATHEYVKECKEYDKHSHNKAQHGDR